MTQIRRQILHNHEKASLTKFGRCLRYPVKLHQQYKLLLENGMETEKALGMSLLLAQMSPEDGAENGRAIHFVRQ